jgi:acid stress-induced BolA-like protein IbaG/YrbA
MTPDEIKEFIANGIPDSEVLVDGDGQHFQAIVVSSAFEGLSMLKQHQMVYAALGNAMESAIHALSIKTYTPEQWQQARKLRVL